MTGGQYRFDRFTLDMAERQLRGNDGAVVELSNRYLDALALMTTEAGKLIPKDRFMDEVWRGVPVTDEALTQCIRSLRKALGDDAARPRFIETVPKHGYRFIAEVEQGSAEDRTPHLTPTPPYEGRGLNEARPVLVPAGLAALGGGVAGGIGGLIYGFGAVSQPLGPGMGQASVLLVLICLSILVGLAGGGAVGLGVAGAARLSGKPWRWAAIGGATGGLIVGALAKMLGLDAFNLLLGKAPGAITGGMEGAFLGGAVGLGLSLAAKSPDGRPVSPRRAMAWASITGGLMGLALPLLGGRLMAGSLASLTELFPDSRLRFDQLGTLFGEHGFGPISQMVTGALEGSLFGACVAIALVLAKSEHPRRRA